MFRSLFFAFAFLSSQSGFGQSQFELSLNGKALSNGSFVALNEFQNIKVKIPKGFKGKRDDLELQFVIIPFGDTLLSFKQPISDLKSLEMEEKLNYIHTLPENISHILLFVTENMTTENETQFNAISVITRQLISAEDYFKEFGLNATHGKINEAISYVIEAIALDPTNLEYNNAFGQLLFEVERYAESKIVFQRITEKLPNYLAFAFLGAIYIKEKDWENAKNNFNEALLLTTKPEELSYIYFSFGEIEEGLFNYSGAYDYYKTSIKHNPKNMLSLNNVSIVCSKVGKGEEKMNYLKQIIEIDSSFIPAHINIGFQLLKENQFEEALGEFNYVIEKDPENAMAINNKSFALYKLNLLDEALEAVNRSIELDATNSYAFKNRALIYIQQTKNDLACTDLSKALELNFTKLYGDEVDRLINENCKGK